MKLVTYRKGESNRIGCLIEKDPGALILDLHHQNPDIPTDMKTFLEFGETGMTLAKIAMESCGQDSLIPFEEVSLLAPILNPGKILCLGLNYRDHAAETNKPLPEYPTIFPKYANCVIGPLEPIRVPRVSQAIDYEVELAVVIGKKTKHVSETEAMECIAGYTALNDVSARDYQSRTTQWTSGKIFDTFAPLGPALVTTDEITDPGNLDIILSLNGKPMQRSNTKNLIFSVPFLISYLSDILTLEPGDIISTGTPAGVGHVRKPPVFLKNGDLVKISIEKIGDLINPVLDEC
jgi:acylpyruvate hydrolase